MSSSSLTRDFSSPTSCSRLASDSFVRARSPRAPLLLPVPDAGPGLSALVWPPFADAGGTSARCSLGFVGAAGLVVGAGVDFGSPVLATSVGFETGTLPLVQL